MPLTKLFNEFFNSEKSAGLVLVFATVASLLLANSPLSALYTSFWNTDLGGHELVHWINDGLMAVFFLLIGLELEREIYIGELSGIKKASLPVLAALGGMLLPAAIYLSLNYGTATQSGAGIPMATDIAFAVGILSLLGKRVPASLKVFLTALAVIDDLGAVIVIAVFYTQTIVLVNLFIALGILGVLILLNRLGFRNLLWYLPAGFLMWYFMLHSGVHATIAGVLLAFAIPFRDGGQHSPSRKVQHFLHKPVAFFILPIFALANTSIPLDGDLSAALVHWSSLGIIAGLVIGKPLGIFLFSYLGVRLRLGILPADLKWKNILGAGFLGGIGFTMSIFITLLAFNDEMVVNHSKIAIIAGSVIAGTLGFLLLYYTLKQGAKSKRSDKRISER